VRVGFAVAEVQVQHGCRSLRVSCSHIENKTDIVNADKSLLPSNRLSPKQAG
jgi:hypothetical protein